MFEKLLAFLQGANEGWLAAKDWVHPDGKIDMETLDKHFHGASICATAMSGWVSCNSQA